MNKTRAMRAQPIQLPLPPIPEGHHVRGVSTLVGNQWIKTAKDQESREEVLARLLADLPSRIPARKGRTPAPRGTSKDLLAVYPLGDPHVGLLAWSPETGADFDLKICEDLMTRAMRDLVLRGPRADQALVLNLGDFFHADTGDGHTTKGSHVLDMDGRAPRVLAVGFRIMVALISAALEHHRTVTVDNRIGNHDGHTALMLAIGLAAYFRNEPRVKIPATVAHRSYYLHGANLIGVTHGDRAKGEDLAQIMAAERPEDWGKTRNRVWYTGHVHHATLREYRGVQVESFRTLAGRDSWHAAQGYVSGRDAHRITLHAEDGEIGREIVNLDRLTRQARAA